MGRGRKKAVVGDSSCSSNKPDSVAVKLEKQIVVEEDEDNEGDGGGKSTSTTKPMEVDGGAEPPPPPKRKGRKPGTKLTPKSTTTTSPKSTLSTEKKARVKKVATKCAEGEGAAEDKIKKKKVDKPEKENKRGRKGKKKNEEGAGGGEGEQLSSLLPLVGMTVNASEGVAIPESFRISVGERMEEGEDKNKEDDKEDFKTVDLDSIAVLNRLTSILGSESTFGDALAANYDVVIGQGNKKGAGEKLMILVLKLFQQVMNYLPHLS